MEDPVKLHEEFESQYKMDEYEQKITPLLSHAYKRIKKSDPRAALEWDGAINKLREGVYLDVQGAGIYCFERTTRINSGHRIAEVTINSWPYCRVHCRRNAMDVLAKGTAIYLLVLWGRMPLESYLRLLIRLVVLVSIALGLSLGLRYLLRPLGVSLASFMFFLFAATAIAVTLKPQPLATYLERAALKVVVFLIGRRKSNNST